MTTTTSPPCTAGPPQHTPRPIGLRLAAALSEVFAPLVQVLVQSTLVLWHPWPDASELRWWLLAVAFGSAVPMLFLIYGMRRGSWLDHHVPQREHRILPMIAILASLLLGFGALSLAGAPRPICAVFALLAIQLAVLTLITRWWKISVHTSVATTTVAVAALVGGPLLLAAFAPIAPLTVWTRTHMRAHTLGQAVTGVLIGTAICAVALPLLA